MAFLGISVSQKKLPLDHGPSSSEKKGWVQWRLARGALGKDCRFPSLSLTCVHWVRSPSFHGSPCITASIIIPETAPKADTIGGRRGRFYSALPNTNIIIHIPTAPWCLCNWKWFTSPKELIWNLNSQGRPLGWQKGEEKKLKSQNGYIWSERLRERYWIPQHYI